MKPRVDVPVKTEIFIFFIGNQANCLVQVKPIVIDALTQGIMTVVNDALSRYPIGNLTSVY